MGAPQGHFDAVVVVADAHALRGHVRSPFVGKVLATVCVWNARVDADRRRLADIYWKEGFDRPDKELVTTGHGHTIA